MWRACLPAVIWAAHFGAIYGLTALACARQMAALVPWVVGLASVIALAGLLALAIPAGLRALRSARLADSLAAGLGGLAMVAVAWEGAALFWVPACA
jgi:hypothetical protein